MALPVVPIISAVTPLVLGALDLYRRRSGAHLDDLPAAEAAGRPRQAGALNDRLRALEDSDLEQARLLSELSRNVEALARAVASQQEDSQRRARRMKRVVAAALALAGAALVLALLAWTAVP